MDGAVALRRGVASRPLIDARQGAAFANRPDFEQVKQQNEQEMTALTTAAVQSLIGLMGGMRTEDRPQAPWMRYRTSEEELERLRIAESHVTYRF
ncbi:hypothetical protein C8J28_108213 [Cereibacter azotoformans]|uniref:Uncharacterized protein n=2 Tax=Cereibacter azotoformans TaxID=43057 RepID=A0A2T5K825_9RHOB|nr:hypothetical protein C8J28_108213 [Cereibacter azotoformans]